uniref:Helicase-associated domain-containing protein n=1 Tax=Hyaloperonospora arabidopsidis (strain Emoy2) TaxID=559515 RepID=M4C2Q3_HYAAE
MLQSIGFPFADWRTYVWEQQLLPALRVFQALEGHLFVRQDFQVPLQDPKWPRAAWGVNLGSLCQVLRRDASVTRRRDDDTDRLAVDRRDVLNAMGFIWSDTQWKWETQFLKALDSYRALFGHCNVHHTFRVPSLGDKNGGQLTAFWPAATAGYRLGHIVAKVRTSVHEDDQALTLQQVAELQELEFFSQVKKSTMVWRDAILPSLRLYPKLFQGETCIPVDFVVPDDDDRWPEKARGMKLGYIVASIQLKQVFQAELRDDRRELTEIGYTWEALVGKWAKELVPALYWYKKTFGHCDVPSYYVVPMTETSWPKKLRGYQLGKQVVRVRRSGRGNDEVADVLMDLDAIGFKFSAFESNFVDRVLPALEVYAKTYGDTHVPQGFIVPSESTWPQPSWGTKLGHTVRNIRNRRQHAQQVEKYRERLKNIGFVWSIYKSTAATKRDIVDPCVAIYKKEHGKKAEIPRSFVVPADDSRYPEMARSFELGAWLARYNKRTNGLLPIQTQEGRKKAVAARHTSVERNLTPHAEQYWKDVLLCSFQVYAKLHGSCKGMDGSFVVPNENAYPQPAWGLNLGLRLRHLRHGIRYTKEIEKYKHELLDLGVLLYEDTGPLESKSGEDTNREDGCRENGGLNDKENLNDEGEFSTEEDNRDDGEEDFNEEDDSEECEDGTTGREPSSRAHIN